MPKQRGEADRREGAGKARGPGRPVANPDSEKRGARKNCYLYPEQLEKLERLQEHLGERDASPVMRECIDTAFPVLMRRKGRVKR